MTANQSLAYWIQMGRCGRPCGLMDSRLLEWRRKWQGMSRNSHHCIREPNHTGLCDFIGTCGHSLK